MPGNFVRCHIRIVQPAADPHPLSSAVGRRTQVHRDAFNGALQQQRPLFASRASPKRPTDQSIRSIIAVILLVDRNARNQTRFTPGKKNVIENCVHALAPCGRGWLREAKTGEGCGPSISLTPHPARTSSAPPSPTRGEGK